MSSFDLPPETTQFLDGLVARGEFASRDEAVVAAVHLMRLRRERLEALKGSLQEASDQLDAGDVGAFSLEEILAEGRRLYAAQHAAK